MEDILKGLDDHSEVRKEFLKTKYKEMTLEDKENWALERIKEFLDLIKQNKLEKPFISFSGGKDSCVLEHLVHRIDPSVQLITSAEFFHPEVAKLLSKKKTTIIPSKMSFEEVLKTYGLPVMSKAIAQVIQQGRKTKDINSKYYKLKLGEGKWSLSKSAKKVFYSDIPVSNKCCDMIKGNVKHIKRPCFVGTTIFESKNRLGRWLSKGCIVFENNISKCTPLSLFTEEDIWNYIKKHNVEYAKAYDMGWKRTGCLMCHFGCSFKDKRQELLLVKKHYPKIWEKYYPYFEKFYKLMNYKELIEGEE